MSSNATLLEIAWVLIVLIPGILLLLLAWGLRGDSRAPKPTSAPRPERSGPRPVWARGRGEGVRSAIQGVDGLGVPEAHRVDPQGLDGTDSVRRGNADAGSPEEDIEHARRRAG